MIWSYISSYQCLALRMHSVNVQVMGGWLNECCTYEWQGGWGMDRWDGRELDERMDKYIGGW